LKLVDVGLGMDSRGIGSVFLSLLFGFSTWIFWKRRHLYPIKSRDPVPLALIGLLLTINYVNLIFTFDWYPGALRVWIWILSINGVLIFYTFRCWTLLFRWEIIGNLLTIYNLKKDGKAGLDMEGWFLRHRWMVLPSTLVKVAIVDYVITFCYLIASTAVDPGMTIWLCTIKPSTIVCSLYLYTFYIHCFLLLF